MTTLTVPEAIAAGWTARAQLYRDIKKGRVAAQGKRWRMTVDTDELIRVYGAPALDAEAPHPDDVELDVLRHENRRLREHLDREHEHGTELLVMTWRYAMTGALPPLPSWRLWRWLFGYESFDSASRAPLSTHSSVTSCGP